MLKLRDFYHLPELDAFIQEIVNDGSGIVIAAGPDPRPLVKGASGEIFLPSGRSAFFDILVLETLEAHPSASVVFVTKDKASARVPRQLKRRVRVSLVDNMNGYPEKIAEAVEDRPGILVIDHFSAQDLVPVLEAARRGIKVLTQVDTVFWGAEAVHQLFPEAGSPGALSDCPLWIVSVQRLGKLCPKCRQAAPPGESELERLRLRYPDLDLEEAGLTALPGHEGEGKIFYQAGSCAECHHTGRSGDIAIFDVYRTSPGSSLAAPGIKRLPLEKYLFSLATGGLLSLEDLLQFDTRHLRRTFNLLVASEAALTEANAALQRRLAELEAANRVLQQRTEVLISLEDLGQALIASTRLDELAASVCRRACTLCGADRAILYYLPSSKAERRQAEVLAVNGWGPSVIRTRLDAALVTGLPVEPRPSPHPRLPPGVPEGALVDANGDRIALLAGLRLPLTAQGRQVGAMIVHSIRKRRFTPGEVALLQTYANQAALAIQRTELIQELQAKIRQLEEAQAELVQKERLERELELARQVQQSMLPRTFPQVPGITIAARNEPARQVGGDLYDVIALDGDRLGLVIADVADKGMPAALYMALTRSLMISEAPRSPSPSRVLAGINRSLLELGEPNKFVSMFFGILDCKSLDLTFTRAGHDRPLLLRDGAARFLQGKGAVLGVLDEEDLHLTDEQIALAKGDRLVLYTDGLTDVSGPDGQFFGLPRLEELLLAQAGLSPQELCAATFAELSAFQGSAQQFDDMTMLVVQIE